MALKSRIQHTAAVEGDGAGGRPWCAVSGSAAQPQHRLGLVRGQGVALVWRTLAVSQGVSAEMIAQGARDDKPFLQGRVRRVVDDEWTLRR